MKFKTIKFYSAIILALILCVLLFVSLIAGVFMFTLYKIHIDFCVFGIILTFLIPAHLYACLDKLNWWICLEKLERKWY